jgi:hypothetical protein
MKTLSINSKLKISSPVLDLKKHAQLRACIELSANEIILALFTLENELVYLEHFVLKANERAAYVLEYLAQNNEFFAHSYATVSVGHSSWHYTLVPGALFDSANKEQLLRFNHPIASQETVLSDEIFSAESFCVYSVDPKVKGLLDRIFPNNHVKHVATCLIEGLPAVSSKTHKTCLVHVGAERMDVALYHKKLLFFNSFQYQTAEDFLYFILASLEQNGAALEETEVVLAGEIEAGSALYHTIHKYIPKVKFAVTDKNILKKNDFVKLPEHFYFSLFNLYLCGL